MKADVLNSCFCFQNALKLTYEHLHSLKILRGLYSGPPLKAKGRDLGGKEREDRWGEMAIRE
jgi:hypothetical protein